MGLTLLAQAPTFAEYGLLGLTIGALVAVIFMVLKFLLPFMKDVVKTQADVAVAQHAVAEKLTGVEQSQGEAKEILQRVERGVERLDKH